MTGPFALRPATPADAPAIGALVRSLARYFLADPERPQDAEAFFRTLFPEAIAANLEGGRFRYHLLEADGALAGVVGVRDGSHLYHLFVEERFHRRGLATRLWEHARRDAGDPERFTVNASLIAVPLYERLGFAATGPVVVQDGIAFRPMERA